MNQSSYNCTNSEDLNKIYISYKPLPFTGKVTPDCQDVALPTGLKLFVSMLFANVVSELENQASLTIPQLINFKTKHKPSVAANKSRQSKEREPPLPL